MDKLTPEEKIFLINLLTRTNYEGNLESIKKLSAVVESIIEKLELKAIPQKP